MHNSRNPTLNKQQREQRKKQQRGKNGGYRGGYETQALNESTITAERNMSDDMYAANTLTDSVNLYDTVGGVNYGENVTTRGGGSCSMRAGCGCGTKGGCGSQKTVGGCFTCKKGKKKINVVLRSLILIIPRLYNQYKKQSKAKQPRAKQPKAKQPRAKQPRAKQPRARGMQGMKGGLLDWSDWDGSYVWRANPESGIYKYNENMLDLRNLGFGLGRTNDGIYKVDTSLTDYTSKLAL